MIAAKVQRQLQQLDWDFDQGLPGTSKTIHWYPGTYPADLPTTVIQALTKPNDLVFDPYGGSGTTAIEAARQLRRAWVVDSNPIGSLISYVSCGSILLAAIDRKFVSMLVDNVRSIVLKVKGDGPIQHSLAIESDIGSDIDLIVTTLAKPDARTVLESYNKTPCYDNLQEWIDKRTLADIRALVEEFSESPVGAFGRLLFTTMLSAVLRPASSQTQSWGHIADNVHPKIFVQKDVFRLALQWLSRFDGIISKTEIAALPFSLQHETRVWVSNHNWSSDLPKGQQPGVPCALMMTSPPYAGAIDYTFAQRLSLYAIGFEEAEIEQLSRGEYGARRRRNRMASQETWAEELVLALDRQLQYMGAPAFSAFVLPHKDEGRDVGTQILTECLESSLWNKLIQVDRSIRQVRTRQSWTSIKKETLHIAATCIDRRSRCRQNNHCERICRWTGS